MTMLFTQTHTHAAISFKAEKKSLLVYAGGAQIAHLCGLPDHVAEHTAAAFNRAMQAVPVEGLQEGWTYQGKTGLWHITCPMPRVYLGQHDEVTGDGDPMWMFAQGETLMDALDVIDAQEAEHMEEAA